MMFFKKKKEVEEEDDLEEDTENNEPETSQQTDPSMIQISAGLEKLKAQFSTFFEIQKTVNERFSGINEQIGGLRSQILDIDKESKMVEAKALKSIDMVESVQPDKLMLEVKKLENKIELVKSNTESNQIMMNNSMDELKEMRTKINSMRGVEESIKLAEEVRNEWLENKKVNATITKHASKVEMIYSEMWKEFGEFKKLSGRLEDIDKSMKTVSSEVDDVVVKIKKLSEKKEVENLLSKFEDFQKHVDNVVYTLNNKMTNFENELRENFDTKMDKATKLIKGFELLAKTYPDLDKYFNMIESKGQDEKKESVNVEKIKKLEEDSDIKEEQKPSIINKITEKIGK